jgi:hypothetical protein
MVVMPPKKKADAPRKKRAVLTSAEQIERAEARLEELRRRAAEKDSKASGKLIEKRNVLLGQISEREKKVAAIDEELVLLGVDTDQLVPVEAPAPTED